MAATRILFVDQAGEIGGAELSLFDIARHHCQNAEVVLFDEGPFKERLTQAEVPVTVLQVAGDVLVISRDHGYLGAMKALPGLVRLTLALARKARKYDILYANSQKAFVVAALASWICRRPLIWHLRDMLTASHFSRAMRGMVVRLANKRASCVIANSNATAEAFAQAGGRCRTVVIYNGIDSAPFRDIDATDTRKQLARSIGCGDAPLVGVFSRLAPWKGQHVAIEAARSLPGVHIILVGGALFGEQTYEAELRVAAKKAGVDDRIHFLGFRNDVPTLLSAVDVVLHTSIAPEPFGRVIVEGMLAKRPVIATAAGGALEIIENGVTGILVPPGDATTLAFALRALLALEDRGSELARRGHDEAIRRFSLPTCLAKIDEVIRQWND